MEAPRLHVKDASGFSGVWREVHFEEWQAPGTAAMMRARHVKRQAFLAELGPSRTILTIAIIRDEAIKRLDDDQRAAINEGVAQVGNRAKAAAVMIGADGFKAVIIRSIIAALTLVSGAKYPTKTFDDLAPVFAWLAPFLEADAGGAPSAHDLAAAYRALVEQAARA